jgi:nucleoside-diphosphate kinase
MPKIEMEQTLVLIKPDALRNSLTGFVLSQLSEFHTGLRFAGAKIVHVTRMLAAEHYAEHRAKPFFPALLDYLMGISHYPEEPWKRRVMAFVYQGPAAARKIREVAGPTSPAVARIERPGCIRALGTVSTIKDAEGLVIAERMDNLIHASANAEEAGREIRLWFKPNDIPPLMHAYPTEICDAHYYFHDGKLFTAYSPGSTCLLAPGDTAWKSDLETLRLLILGRPASCSVEAVAAKYMINEARAN